MSVTALVTDITPNRATVAALLSAEEAAVRDPSDETLARLDLRRDAGGAGWDLMEVPEGTEVGERIWR